MDLETLPPTLLLQVTTSDDPEFPVDSIETQRIARLDDECLSFENREEDGIFGLAGDPESIIFKRAPPRHRSGNGFPGDEHEPEEIGVQTGNAASSMAEPGICPTQTDLVGTWHGDDNGLAQVFFTLELSEDGAFALHRRDTAPQFEETTRGTWELDADATVVILRRATGDGQEPAEGGLKPVDQMTVSRADDSWILSHDIQGRYFQHANQSASGRR